MRNSIRKRCLAVLTAVFMLLQFLPGQLLGQIMSDNLIVSHAAFYADDVEREIYKYIKNKGFNDAATCGILAAMYLEPESEGFDPNKAGFNCDVFKRKIDEYVNVMEMDAAVKDSLKLFGRDAMDLSKKSYLYKLKNMSNSREGAYAAGKDFCDFLNEYFHKQSCPLPENYAVLSRDVFWPKYQKKDRILNMHAYQQDDSNWSKHRYGYDNIGISGCALLSMTNMVYALTGKFISPVDLADYVMNTDPGLIIPNDGGTYWRFFFCNAVNGIHCTGPIITNWNTCTERLNNGDVVVANVPGHYLVISAYDPETDKYRVLDSAAGYRDYGGYSGWPVRPTSDLGTWLSREDFYGSALGLFSGDRYAYSFNTGSNNVDDIYVTGGAGRGEVYLSTGIYRLKGKMYFKSDSNMYSESYSVIYSGTELEVVEIQNGTWGKTYYNGRYGWVNVSSVYADYLRPLELIKKPNAPSLSLDTASDVALNSISTVSWGAVDGADSYNITVYNESGAEVEAQTGITATQTSFTLSDAGTYTVKGVAVNSKYTSDVAEMSAKIVVHPNSLVTFLSEVDGSELNKQSVPYGADAALPEIPTKKGFTFIGWDGNYTAVKQDTTIVAKWQRNKYNVNFYNGTGSTLDSQRVLYEDAATEPPAPSMEGYTFQGWDKKFDYIEDNMDIYPIFSWENENLPVIISGVKAERDSTGYNVSYSLQNTPGQSTQCRLVISLKTAEGKLITYTESTAYNLREEGVITDTIYVPSQEVASIVEINAVRKFSLVIPIAENKSSEVTGDALTNWSTEKPPADAFKVEQRTEYRYRTKTIRESNEKLASPWVLEKETTGYTDYGPEQRSDSPVAASDTRSVEVKNEQHHDFVGYRMVYHCSQENWYPYNRMYRDYSIRGRLGEFGARPTYGYDGENTNLDDPLWIKVVSQVQLDSANITPPGAWFEDGQRGINKGNKNGYNFPSDTGLERTLLWFVDGEVYNDYTTTYYIYKDREKIPVYTYLQLSDYSAWSTEKPEESEDKVIEERVVYRYVHSDTNTTENTDGEMRTITGNVDPVFAGKQAILFVYKIDEAADYTNEAVAQTTIGENGEYSFEFKLREEPTSMSVNGEKKPTGDFTVTLGIEGTSSVIYLDPIKAPTPEYTVEYVDYDGTVLLSTTVKDGEAAPIPETIPERKGYTFAGWNNDPSEIHANVTMTAIYTKNVYTVAFVDWSNESVVLQQYKYGDPILPPEVKVPTGMVFKGWDILLDGTSVVTENLVAVATYEPKQLEVSFVDYDGKVISTQTVEYGKTAVLPDALDDLTDRAFMCWNISQNTSITEDIVVEPVVNYFETAETPNVSLESDAYDTEQTVEITTSDKSKIYYTLDGSDPSENGLEYNGTIKITKSCVLKCIAKDNNKNNSAVVTRYFAINNGEALTDYMDYSLLPEYVRQNAADYKVTSTKGYRYLMKNNVKSKSEYDSLLKSGWTVESESWSEWSDWTTSLDGTSDMIIEQNSKDAEPVDVLFYQYSHYKYYDEVSKSYQYSATELEGVECSYESIESPDKLTIAAFVDGVSTYTLNGQTWFNQESIMKSVIPGDKLYQYRYKTIVMTKMSDWVEKLPDGAEAVEEGKVFCYVEPERYIVEIRSADGATLYKNLEIANKTLAIDDSVLEREGFIITGLVDEDGNEWNLDKDAVTENIVLTVNYNPITYTVTFKAPDGTVVKECTVDCFMNAVPPVMESDNENVFVGWDSDKYLSVTENMVVTAKYISADEMPTLKSAHDSYYMYPGNTRILSALTFNIDKETETIIWTSMNPKIATVTDDGKLEAISEGETDIVISELSSGLMAICTVNVVADPSLGVDDNLSTTASTTTTTTITTTSTTTIATTPTSISATTTINTTSKHQGFYYKKIEDGVEITGFDETITGNVIIPEEIDSLPVIRIGEYASFQNEENTSDSTLSNDGLLKIYGWDYTLVQKDVITSVSIPGSVTVIGESAFWGCKNLKQINFSYGLEKIESHAFMETGITEAELPDSVKYIGASTFYGCQDLSKIALSKNLEYLGMHNFNGSKLESNISNGDFIVDGWYIAYIARNATYPKVLSIPEGTIGIAEQSYIYIAEKQNDTTKIIIPSSLETISDNAFRDYTGLEAFEVAVNNPYFSAENGVLYNKEQTRIIRFPIASPIVNYSFPNTITSTSPWAFCYCQNLNSVTMNNELSELGGAAFVGCNKLKYVTFSKNISKLYSNVYRYIIGGKGNSDYEGTFQDCDSLEEITIPENIDYIGDSSFAYCKNLKKVIVKNPICEIVNNYEFETTFTNGYDDNYNEIDIIKLYGYKNSTVQAYAEKYGKWFVAFDEELVTTTTLTTTSSIITTTTTSTTPRTTTTPPTTTEPAYLLGDVNNDGSVDSSDASLVLAEYAKIQTGGAGAFTDIQCKAADVNKDNSTDSSDASKILAYYAMISTGKEPTWD